MCKKWVAAACMVAGSVTGMAQTRSVTVPMVDGKGADVGMVMLSQQGSGVQMQVMLKGLPAGEHGIHVHAVGTCTPPDFTSAGGHLNPTSKHHGFQNPDGHHAGDFPSSLTVAQDGTVNTTLTSTDVSLDASSPASVYGKAIVVHAAADDQKTDPSGASGARIACGVVPEAGAM